MGIELPDWLDPLVNLYGIPWPDVDEDAFHHIQQPLRDFGKDLVAVSDAIEMAINDLESGNPSQTLTAMRTYVAEIRKEFLDPVQGVCSDLAGTPCETAYDLIRAVKLGLIAALAAEVGSDALDVVETAVTFGLDTGLTTAQALAVREAIRLAIQQGEAEVAGQLQSVADSYLDNFVNSLVNPFIDSVDAMVEARLGSYLPRFVLEGAKVDEAAAKALHLDPNQLNTCVTDLAHSSEHLDQAATKLDSAIDEIFSKPDPVSSHIHNLSQDMRIALKSVVKTIRADLVAGIEKLIRAVENHFVTLLEDFAKAIEELDADARRAAQTEHMAGSPEVVMLSVAGTWIAASARVDEASVRLDAREAERVQVVEAEPVGFSVTSGAQAARPAGLDGSNSPVVAQDVVVERIDMRTELHGPGMAEADKGLLRVDELKVPANQGATPHVDLAQAPGVNAQGVTAHHADQHAAHLGVVEGSTTATDVQHLHDKQDAQKPTATTAEPYAEEVEGTPPSSSGN